MEDHLRAFAELGPTADWIVKLGAAFIAVLVIVLVIAFIRLLSVALQATLRAQPTDADHTYRVYRDLLDLWRELFKLLWPLRRGRP